LRSGRTSSRPNRYALLERALGEIIEQRLLEQEARRRAVVEELAAAGRGHDAPRGRDRPTDPRRDPARKPASTGSPAVSIR
jgi:hypothetical protein